MSYSEGANPVPNELQLTEKRSFHAKCSHIGLLNDSNTACSSISSATLTLVSPKHVKLLVTLLLAFCMSKPKCVFFFNFMTKNSHVMVSFSSLSLHIDVNSVRCSAFTFAN